MSPLKEATINTIKRLPDDCTIDDIMYEINFVAQIYEGLEDSREGRTISTEELINRVETWGK
jgi:predicted transcriptional regulator